METVYIETTIVSYLAARRSRVPLVAGEQDVTERWWTERRPRFNCVSSEEAVVEASRGDAERAAKRLILLRELHLYEVTSDAYELADEFLATGSLPVAARTDAVHLAVATLIGSDYLLTWNCRHLANAQILRRLAQEASGRGWRLPMVCTPLELMGD